MSSLDPNIGGDTKDPFKELEQLRKSLEEKKEKQLFSEDTKEGDSAIQALIINSFQKILALFSNKERKIISQAEDAFIDQDIGSLKNLLEQLEEEDLSHNFPFLQKLSHSWHQIIEHADLLYPNDTFPLRHLVDQFVLSCNSYPKGEDKTIGFYLSHFAGEEWIPFPFMTLLQQLHAESLSHKPHSQLRRWIEMLEEIENSDRG